MSSIILKLYISGKTLRSDTAVSNLNKVCSGLQTDNYQIEIIDLVNEPDRADLDRIFATPTLIRTSPEPQRRVIGDLSNTKRVLTGLELLSLESANSAAEENEND